LIGDEVAIALGQFLLVILGVSARIGIVLLEGAQVLLEMVVIALVFAHDGAVDLIVMDLSLPLSVGIEFLPLYELSLEDFLDALLPLGGLVLIQALAHIPHLLFRHLLVALLQSLQIANLIHIPLGIQFSE
jgi:hypothetical protein